jgi:hypothetical protein
MLAPKQLQHEFRASEMGATFVALQKFLNIPCRNAVIFRRSRAIGGAFALPLHATELAAERTSKGA